jgi:hypothetical protein
MTGHKGKGKGGVTPPAPAMHWDASIQAWKTVVREGVRRVKSDYRPRVCPRCRRIATGWPLRRPDICSPSSWVFCTRNPQRDWPRPEPSVERIERDAEELRQYDSNHKRRADEIVRLYKIPSAKTAKTKTGHRR